MKNLTWGAWMGRVVVGSLICSAVVPMMHWGFNSHLTIRELAINYLFSLAYAACIGAILFATTGYVWTRTCQWPLLIKWITRASLIVSATAIGSALAGLVPLAIYGKTYEYWASFVGSFKIGLIISVSAVAFVSMYEQHKSRMRVTAMELKTKELERERALKLATEARLSSLESRIHPHFLFNTINSVSSLIHEDPRRAERLLTQMAGLLRFSLDSTQTGLVPLERELRIVEDYLDIEKARFEDRLRFKVTVASELGSIEVLPLSIQTLVENSVKYAVSSRRGGARIDVDAGVSEGQVWLDVRDDGPGFRDLRLPAGHGLSNLQERLFVLFGNQGKLEIESNENSTCVRISLPYAIPAGRNSLPPRQNVGDRESLELPL